MRPSYVQANEARPLGEDRSLQTSHNGTKYLPSASTWSSYTGTETAGGEVSLDSRPPVPPRKPTNPAARKTGVSFTQRFRKNVSSRTMATFFSPLAKSHQTMQRLSLETTDLHTAGESNRKGLDQIDLNGFHLNTEKKRLRNAKDHQNSCSTREKILSVLLGLALMALIGVGFIAFQEEIDEVGILGDFCVSGDENVRQLLADRFDEMFSNGAVTYTRVIIDCLPSDAFSNLNDAQKQNLQSSSTLTFNGNAMEKISGDAFIAPELSSITSLTIEENGISFLPDNLLEPMKALQQVSFARNALVDIETEVFRRSTVDTITLDINPLIVIPSALRGLTNLKSLFVTACPSIVGAESDLLAQSGDLQIVGVAGTSLNDFFPSVEDLGAVLGVDPTIVNGF